LQRWFNLAPEEITEPRLPSSYRTRQSFTEEPFRAYLSSRFFQEVSIAFIQIFKQEQPMPRRDIPFLPDQYYHFYNRGNNRQAIFFERDNYLYFLKGIKKYLRPYLDILVYSLMPTHYHIFGRVRQTSQTQNSEFLKNSEFLGDSGALGGEEISDVISNAMMRLGVSYTKAINKRFARVGALFQGQFQGKPVRNYQHLLNLCIYIHANPVKDGLVSLPEEWEYSNYLEWLNLREGTLVNRAFIHEHFGPLKRIKSLSAHISKPETCLMISVNICKIWITDCLATIPALIQQIS
jgi:putative transposase